MSEKEAFERALELFGSNQQTESDVVHTECRCGRPISKGKWCKRCNQLWLYWLKVVKENAIR